MNFAFSRGAGAAARRRAPVPGGEVAVGRGAAADGDDRGLRRRGLDADGARSSGSRACTIPEEYGGQGFTFVELGIVLEEMGRVLLCAPYFSTVVLAANAILNAGTDEQKGELLPGIASGETIAALAFTEPNGKWDAVGHHDGGPSGGDSYTLDGTKMFVIDGHIAEPDRRRRPRRGHARRGRHLVLHRRRRRRRPHPHAARDDGPDPQAGPARLRRRRGHAARRGRRRLGRRCRRRSTRPRSRWPTRWSAARRRCLDMSVEYAKVRVQFGRPIGSFQAIKHKCADMLLEVESAKSAAYYAAWAAAEDNDELPGRREPRQGVLLRRVLPRRRREHPDPRRHRLHVGARRAPVLQAREVLRDPPRRRHVPPRAARAAHRDLTRAIAPRPRARGRRRDRRRRTNGSPPAPG